MHLRGLTLVILVLSLGIGSTVTQVIAWATMLPAQFSESGSVEEAVRNTFDGKHACSLCKLADAQREAEESNSAPAGSKNQGSSMTLVLRLYQILVAEIYAPSGKFIPYWVTDERAEHISVLPEVPPPDCIC